MNNEFQYAGMELELFSHAVNWKKYFSSFLHPYIQGKVLEVGAGIGTTTPFLHNSRVKTWTCLEPDKLLYDKLKTQDEFPLPGTFTIIHGDLSLLPENKYDCILYIDVLEHILNDKQELDKAVSHLDKNGYLVILAPAYNFLLNDFDKAIGHYRRYTRTSIRRIIAPFDLIEKKIIYLESCGIFLLLLNKFLFKKIPIKKNILFWDKYLVPLSKLTDKLSHYSFGKSLVAVLQRKND